MKKYLAFLCCFIVTVAVAQQTTMPFKDGEQLRYKMSYSGFLRAGTAVLEVKEKILKGKAVYYTKGTGWTSGMIKWFFKVEDLYESYFDKETLKPYLFKRKIDEGGYKKHRITAFNYKSNKAYVQDFLKQKDTAISIGNVQDMLSSFYYLRNKDVSKLKAGDFLELDMFLDSQIYPFKLKLLRREVVKSKFGNIKCLVFRPLVQSGRIFKAQESVTLWITDDANKVPLQMRADLAVGSLRADLEFYKGLVSDF